MGVVLEGGEDGKKERLCVAVYVKVGDGRMVEDKKKVSK